MMLMVFIDIESLMFAYINTNDVNDVNWYLIILMLTQIWCKKDDSPNHKVIFIQLSPKLELVTTNVPSAKLPGHYNALFLVLNVFRTKETYWNGQATF